MAADIPELLFDLARSALEQQERQVSELRSRTQALLGAAALVASFVGSTAIDRGGLRVPAVGALLALGLTLMSSLYLLVPRSASFNMNVNSLQRLAEDETADIRAAHTGVALRLWQQHEHNERTLERMVWMFTGATAMLVLQIALWGLALAID